MRVGVHEPVASARDAAQSRAGQARHGDDAVDGEPPVAGADFQPTGQPRHADAARVHAHAAFIEQTSDGGAGRSAEDAQRLLLRGDQAQLDLEPLMSGTVGRGHQCQVVERHRPGRSGRLDEGQLVDPALAELVEQQPVAGAVAAVAEGQHPVRVPFAVGSSSKGEHQHVVGQLVAVLGDDHASVVLDAIESAAMPAGVVLGRNALHPDAAPALGSERLVDGHRAVDEAQLGRDERDVDAIAGQRAQREQRLEPCDPTAGDQHARAGSDFVADHDRGHAARARSRPRERGGRLR